MDGWSERFALAPGVIMGYDRNTYTFKALEDHGYTYLKTHEFLEEYGNKDYDWSKHDSTYNKIAIGFEGMNYVGAEVVHVA